MFIKLCILLLLLHAVHIVHAQICTRRAIVTTTKSIPYLYTYREQYQTRCWYGGSCTKTRISSKWSSKTVPIREVRVVEYCCDGYIRDESSTDDSIICIPICMPSCNNGHCKSPGECECDDGYVPSSISSHNCLPHCSHSCGHGTCSAPERCTCDFGYSFNDTSQSCDPICTEPCINGQCTAPDTCECFEGHRKSENNTCQPYCSKGCDNGTCVRPETCVCNEGYTMVNEQCSPHCSKDCGNGMCIAPERCECDPGYNFENGTCEPICVDTCENGYCSAPFTCTCYAGFTYKWGSCTPHCTNECGDGRCVAPETCECESGFKLVDSCDPTCCQPYCSKPCVHGSCIEPDVCDCDEGYKKDFSVDACVPSCNYDCGNGTCVKPNVCECYPGYGEKEDREIYDPVCVPVCKNCEGNCVAPSNCVCDSQFETRHVTVNGKDCNCYDNCSDTSQQCEKTVCELKVVTETTTEYIIMNTLPNETESFMYDVSKDHSTNDYLNFYADETKFPNNEEMPNYTYTTGNYDEESATAKQNIINETRNSYIWLYITLGVLLIMVLVAVLISIVKRRALANLLSGGSYVVGEHQERPVSSLSTDMQFSVIKRSRNDSYG